MLTKLFWALLVISLVLSFVYRDQLQSIYKNNFVNKYIKNPTDNTGDITNIKDYEINNLTIATGSEMSLKDREYIYIFIKRLEGNNSIQINNIRKNEKDNNDEINSKEKLKPKVQSVYFDIYKDVYLRMSKGEIRLNTLNDLDIVWNDYLSAVEDDKLSSKLKKERENLDYLDLRFPNKLFYRFNNTSTSTNIKLDSTSIKINQYDQRILGTSTISSSTAQ